MKPTPKMIEAFHDAYDASQDMQPRETSQAIYDGLIAATDCIEVTPEMIAAAWDSWHSRHGGKLGPGPAFVEAIEAALRAIK